MKIKQYLEEQKLSENFVVSHKGTVIKIGGFKKGDDTDDLGNKIYTQISKAIDSLKLKKKITNIDIKLK